MWPHNRTLKLILSPILFPIYMWRAHHAMGHLPSVEDSYRALMYDVMVKGGTIEDAVAAVKRSRYP